MDAKSIEPTIYKKHFFLLLLGYEIKNETCTLYCKRKIKLVLTNNSFDTSNNVAGFNLVIEISIKME